MAKAEEKKICTKCGEGKPLEEFKKDRRNKSGYTSTCKVCESERVKEYYRQEGERLVRNRYHGINTRVREFGSILALKYDDFLELVANDNPEENVCSYCGRSEKDELEEHNCRLSLDHIMPLRYGSPHAAWNVTLACKRCNSAKANKHVLEFFQQSEDFTEERLHALIHDMAEQNGCSVEHMEYLLHTSYEAERTDTETPQLKAVI
jgi:5-methylcytosine-specific restriction endonuclease McrA